MKSDDTLEKSVEWKLSQKLIKAVHEFVQSIAYADYYPIAHSMVQAATTASSSIAAAIGKAGATETASDWAHARAQIFVIKSLVASAGQLGYANAPSIHIEADLLADKLLSKIHNANPVGGIT